jgi:hypothetical protein
MTVKLSSNKLASAEQGRKSAPGIGNDEHRMKEKNQLQNFQNENQGLLLKTESFRIV